MYSYVFYILGAGTHAQSGGRGPALACPSAPLMCTEAEASVAVINVFRGAVAVPVLLFAFVLEGKRYSIPKIFTILLIVGGSVISVPFGTFAYTSTGFWLTIVATSCVALKATVSAHADDSENMSASDAKGVDVP